MVSAAAAGDSAAGTGPVLTVCSPRILAARRVLSRIRCVAGDISRSGSSRTAATAGATRRLCFSAGAMLAVLGTRNLAWSWFSLSASSRKSSSSPTLTVDSTAAAALTMFLDWHFSLAQPHRTVQFCPSALRREHFRLHFHFSMSLSDHLQTQPLTHIPLQWHIRLSRIGP